MNTVKKKYIRFVYPLMSKALADSRVACLSTDSTSRSAHPSPTSCHCSDAVAVAAVAAAGSIVDA